jgi:nifR3 family TIM-barrel protein
MREPELAMDLVRAVVEAVPEGVPVTVKHRAGWDALHKNAPDFAGHMVAAGARMITVHGRTRTQGFSGVACLDIIREVRLALPPDVPVVGNGDVRCVDDYFRMRDQTGCDAVVIGRGALGNPWLFRSIVARLHGRPDPGPPDLDERIRVFHRHLSLMREIKAGPKLLHEVRKACAWYAKGLRGANGLRQRIWRLDDPDRVIAQAGEHFAELRQGVRAA